MVSKQRATRILEFEVMKVGGRGDSCFYLDLLPFRRIPPKVHPALTYPRLNGRRRRTRLVSREPCALDLVVPPLARHELLGDKLLYDIARHAVEDVEQRFIVEALQTRAWRSDVRDSVTRRQVVVGL